MMIKRLAMLALAGAMVLAFSSGSSAHIGGAVYPIYELPSEDLPDLNDATLEDWEDVLVGTSLDQNDFQPLNVADGAGINTEDLCLPGLRRLEQCLIDDLVRHRARRRRVCQHLRGR